MSDPTNNRLYLFVDAFLVLFYMSLLFYLSSRPAPAILNVNIPNIDKLYHGMAYGVLGVLLARLAFRFSGSFFWSVWFGTLVGTLYGFSDEFHQSLVPARFSSMGDVIADGVGALLGSLLFVWAVRKIHPILSPSFVKKPTLHRFLFFM